MAYKQQRTRQGVPADTSDTHRTRGCANKKF